MWHERLKSLLKNDNPDYWKLGFINRMPCIGFDVELSKLTIKVNKLLSVIGDDNSFLLVIDEVIEEDNYISISIIDTLYGSTLEDLESVTKVLLSENDSKLTEDALDLKHKLLRLAHYYNEENRATEALKSFNEWDAAKGYTRQETSLDDFKAKVNSIRQSKINLVEQLKAKEALLKSVQETLEFYAHEDFEDPNPVDGGMRAREALRRIRN